MSKEEYLKDISEIKNLMNKSSKFISLSGFSGILAGIYALAGATYFYATSSTILLSDLNEIELQKAIVILVIIGILSTLTTIAFTSKRAKKIKENSWDHKTKNLIHSFTTPLVIGVLFVLILFFKNEYDYLISLLLIFYGTALINSSLRTTNHVKPLGYIQVAFGLICAIFSNYSFIFFTFGFGLVHLIYGCVIYAKFDKKKAF